MPLSNADFVNNAVTVHELRKKLFFSFSDFVTRCAEPLGWTSFVIVNDGGTYLTINFLDRVYVLRLNTRPNLDRWIIAFERIDASEHGHEKRVLVDTLYLDKHGNIFDGEQEQSTTFGIGLNDVYEKLLRLMRVAVEVLPTS